MILIDVLPTIFGRFFSTVTVCGWLLLAALVGCGTANLSIDEMYERAAALLDHGRGEEALQVLDQIIEEDPHPRAYYLRGAAYELTMQLDHALQAYHQCLQKSPRDSDALNNRGSILCRLGKYDEAIQDLQSAIQYNPADDLAWANLSLAQQGLGQLQPAIESLSRAITLRPSVVHQLHLGNLFIEAQEYLQAENVLTESLKSAEFNSSLYLSRAIARAKQGKLEESKRDLEMARRYDMALANQAAIQWINRTIAE